MRRELAREQHPPIARKLERNIGSRVSRAHHEHVAIRQLSRASVVARVHLDESGIELPGEARCPRRAERPGRNYDVRRAEAQLTRSDHEASVKAAAKRVDPHAGADRELE